MEPHLLIRCACNRCGMHIATGMDGAGPVGHCPSCGCAYLAPVRTRAAELEPIALGSTLPRAVPY